MSKITFSLMLLILGKIYFHLAVRVTIKKPKMFYWI